MYTHLQDVAHGHLLTARAIHQEQSKRGEQAYDVLDWSGLVAGTRVAAGLDAFSSSAQVRVLSPEGRENQSQAVPHTACEGCQGSIEDVNVLTLLYCYCWLVPYRALCILEEDVFLLPLSTGCM